MGDCIFEFCTKFCVNISMSDVFLYSMFDTVYSISFKGTHKKDAFLYPGRHPFLYHRLGCKPI